jgi:uncharacterized protein YajQ (UPF0234 family)
MPQEHSVDIVSRVNLQEFRNAIQQAQKELGTRFDFRGSRAAVEFDESAKLVTVTADHEPQLKSVLSVLESKLARRGVPLKSLAWKDPERLPGGTVKRLASLQQGLSSEQGREIVRAIKALGLKVQPRIEGDAVRIVGRQIDDLQTVIRALKARDFGMPLEAENYR